jgi:alkylation response protein AidB-like acyl-CoA dehydrogenase
MAGKMVLSTLSKIMEFMGSYGYAFEYQIEKYYRDVKIVAQGLGGPQRDPLDTIRSYYTFDWR